MSTQCATMKPVSAVDAGLRDNLLNDAASRNIAAELMVMRGENLQSNLRSRLLFSDSDHVLVEAPTENGQPVELQPGQFIEVYFKLGHERFGFDTRVVGSTRTSLNQQTTVNALQLAPPHYLERRQRRKFYRISVASLPPIDAQLVHLEENGQASQPIEARLCNMSAGGVAVLADEGQKPRFVSDQTWRIRFTLPVGDEEPFEFNAIVCHVRHVFQSKRQIIGLAFLPGEDQSIHRGSIERLARFVAAQQREQLFRRKRGV